MASLVADRPAAGRSNGLHRVSRSCLDRIVDVTLQASWWDCCGVQHVQIRDMNSEVSSGTSRPGLRLIVVPEAEVVTDAILDACPALGSEADRMDEVVVLLGELVDKAS